MTEIIDDKYQDLNNYITTINNQEIKILILKLKNEINKTDSSWEQVKIILSKILEKDKKTFNEITPLIL